MREDKLWDPAIPPAWLEADGLKDQGWMRLEGQPGWTERSSLVVELARLVANLRPAMTVSDLGCGDGAMIRALRKADLPLGPMWGYDANQGDVDYAQANGEDVYLADIVAGVTLPDGDRMAYGELIVASEVLEHLRDPAGFLASLPHNNLAPTVGIFTSPSRETAEWHNKIHAWAWDMEGYDRMVERGGWRVIHHTQVAGGTNVFDGVEGDQFFQAVVAIR